MRKMKIFICILPLLLCHNLALGFERYNNVTKYDVYFIKYGKRYFGPSFDWRFFKAQAIAESNLNEEARSWVGAEGIMQIMPRTFEEITGKNPSIKGNRKQPRWNISAGVFYDREIWNLWKAKRPFEDKIGFMFGSYNAGKGNILKAQRLSKQKGMDPNLWESIEKTLPMVTRSRSQETINYVKKINIIKGVLQ